MKIQIKYQVGQLYSVAEASKNETGGGEGIEVLKNEPYEKDGEKGQYTHKIYHLKRRGMLTHIAERNEYMKDDFFIKIETWHKPDLGAIENVHKLDNSTWKSVEVVPIDIADRDQVAHGVSSPFSVNVLKCYLFSLLDYKPDEDPALFKSTKTGRGPLGPNWKKELVSNPESPRMCAYKLVTVKFKWWGLQNKVENFIHK
ncbi:hypothetical protein NFI96_019046, partial [Prochilodus magdalenae]